MPTDDVALGQQCNGVDIQSVNAATDSESICILPVIAFLIKVQLLMVQAVKLGKKHLLMMPNAVGHPQYIAHES